MAESNTEVFPWLKSLPVAPEYHPTLAEFQDPISYIFKIEKEASKYGICKIVPPVLLGPKKTAIVNLNKSLAARPDSSGSANQPTFTTRQQQIGFCPRRPRPVQKPVWQSGEHYTVQQFEAKAKNFEKNYLKKCSKKGSFSALEIETLYWKASVDKPFSVEYANDMPGSAFVPLNSRKGRREVGEGATVGDTEWNMRGVSRAKGSLLRFMKEDIHGVTSPMVYVAMLFSWFAWHVEDQDLHSLNYMHMGAGKTWYGVPRDAAVAVEEVIRVHGYGGEVNPLVTFATLGEKTTVMSPEVFISAGVPCCRLVQNAGEFVVTFPRAYHSGFSHGFNCSEAANIATPEWLTVAKDAAIRRASINYPPMVSHIQLLYDLALELCSRIPTLNNSEPRSSRLKDKKKGEGETMVKEQFVQNVIQNNDLLYVLGKGSRIVLLPPSSSDISVCSNLHAGQLRPRLSLGSIKASAGLVYNATRLERNHEKQVEGFYPLKENFPSFCGRSKVSSSTGKEDLYPLTGRDNATEGDGLSDQRLFSCLTCGVLTFDCVAIIQPREPAAKYLMTADCSFNNWIIGSGDDANDPVQSADYQVQTPDRSNGVPDTEIRRDTSALGLLASTYEVSSDSEEEQGEQDAPFIAGETILRHCSSGLDSGKSSPTRNCHNGACGAHNLPPSRYESGVEVSVQVTHDAENTSFSLRSDDDSSRMHVFCLEHAKEVEQLLRPLGGVNMLLLCHPGYPKVEAEAKLVAQELGIDYLWKDTMFKDATKEEEERIQSAMDDEEAIPGNGDWAVKLGINLYYSANLSRSSLYSKQMPYNSVIYTAFGCSSPASSPTKPNVYRRRSDKQRKVVGKWCGKVWMSNQVHPVLVQKNSDDQEHDKSFGTGTMSDMKVERNLERAPKSEGTKKYGRKRKMAVESASTKKIKSSKQDISGSDDLLGSTHQQLCRRTPKSKQAKRIERDAVSEDLLSRNSLQQRRTLRSKQSKFIERKGAVSDDVMEKGNQQHRPRTRGRRTKHTEIEDTISDGSLEEDVASDDSLEHRSHWQMWRGSVRNKRSQDVEREVSDDSMEHNSLQQYRRALLGKQAKCFEKTDAMSDDSLEQHSSGSKQFKRVDSVSDDSLDDDTLLHDSTHSAKQARCADEVEDAVLDDSLEFKSLNHHRMTLRGKQTKKIEREDSVSDDPLKHNSINQRRTLGGKQAKRGANKEEADSENSCQGKRIVRGKQMKQENSEGTKQGTSQPKKMPKVMKKEAPLDSYVEEGGPSTRLRKRTQRAIEEEVETKHKGKQQKGKKKVKNTSMGKTVINKNAAAKDEEDDYQCDIEGCGMSFDSKQELVLHKRNVCPVKGCGKKFFSHKYLVQHRRVHVDDRPLKCPWKGCKMSFKWAWARTEHIRVHTGARPYVCMESGCGQTFRFVSDFSRHKRKTGHSTKKSRR